MPRPYERKPAEWSATVGLITLHAWRDANDPYWSACVDDAGDTTLAHMLGAFESERAAKEWARTEAKRQIDLTLTRLALV